MKNFTKDTRDLYFSNNSTTTMNLNHFSTPSLIQTIVLQDSIELVYTEKSLMWGSIADTRRVFKEVYSCVDGKWNKSERIYGYISPAKFETYEFES